MRTSAALGTAAVLLLLAACSAPGGEGSADEPDAPGGADTPCVVGTWQLDVPDYGAQSEEYVLGLGLPIEDFAMGGAGTITFTADGLVATEIALTTTGTIVAGDTRVPLNNPPTYAGSGDWSAGAEADTLDLANWSNVTDPGATADPDGAAPAIDYTDIPSIIAICSASDLRLEAPGAPLSTLWHR